MSLDTRLAYFSDSIHLVFFLSVIGCWSEYRDRPILTPTETQKIARLPNAEFSWHLQHTSRYGSGNVSSFLDDEYSDNTDDGNETGHYSTDAEFDNPFNHDSSGHEA
ncbi:hypothetical protein C8R45DRAFT_923170 [Mycena sanguinolenta]|nr:hypothetical protein C8R45DRAFT_923170 [Mycena sanguinolenta]